MGKKWDFRRTYDKCGTSLDKFFENVEWVSVFKNHDIEIFPHLFNEKVLQGWKRFGIFKMVNNKSRP